MCKEQIDVLDFWILDAAVIHVMNVADALYPSYACSEIRLNHASPPDRVLAAIRRLHERGLVYVEKVLRGLDEGLPTETIPDLGNISRHEAVVAAGYYYGLTEIGGGVWENMARPQWCLFFEDT